MEQTKKGDWAKVRAQKRTETIKSELKREKESVGDAHAHVPRRELNNRDVCLFSLAKRGGETGFVPTEDVAITAFELYPQRFGLVKYPHYPDVDSVRVTLTDLRKEKYGVLVQGNKKIGWKLTDAGLAWLHENAAAVELAIEHKHPKERRIRSGKILDGKKIRTLLQKRVYESSAYHKWLSHEEIILYDFFDVMRVDQYTPEEVYRSHIEELTDAARDDPESIRFLRELDSKFGRSYRKGGRQDGTD